MLVLHPTPTAQWHALVNEAQCVADLQLDENLESYLVFLLMRHTDRTKISKNILALDYLEGLLSKGSLRNELLRDVGDLCLLFSGFFPEMAKRRRVRVSYYIDIGRGAYHDLSSNLSEQTAELFAQLSEGFVSLMDIMHAIRALGADKPALDPLTSYELWEDTGSQQAYMNLLSATSGHSEQPLIIESPEQSQKRKTNH